MSSFSFFDEKNSTRTVAHELQEAFQRFVGMTNEVLAVVDQGIRLGNDSGLGNK